MGSNPTPSATPTRMMSGTKVRLLATSLAALLAACGTAAAPTPSPADEKLVVIGRWIDAVNARDADSAVSLMADTVDVGNATLDSADEMRAYILGYVCRMDVESTEAAGDSVLVTVRFIEPDDGSCPTNFTDTTATVVFTVIEGAITRIPAGSSVSPGP